MLGHERFRKNADALWDLREANMPDVTGNDFVQLARFIRSKTEERGSHYKVALVVTSDYQFGVARMYEAHTDRPPVEMMAFRAMEDAECWLDLGLG